MEISKSEYFFLGIGFIVLNILVFFLGWVFAHNTIARECVTLNSFYVGKYVYECKVRQ